MRHLIDRIQYLMESSGLANRKPGDTFKNKEGDAITFSSISFYPDEGGKLEPEQINSLIKQLEGKVKWQNAKLKASGGIIIATFDSPEGQVNFGFFKNDIKPNKLDNYIPNKVDDYKFAGKAAEKVQSGLTPQDLLTKRDNLTAKDIIEQLQEKLGENDPLVQVAVRVANGEEFPIRFSAPEGVSFTGFRDYFCEILQPIALQNGQYTGNAGEAAERFMGGSFGDSLISFDAAKNAGLSDSILTNSEGKYVKISTKGGKGAQASAKNLIDSVNELNGTEAGQKLLDKYSETIELVKNIQQQGQVKAPLYLGVKYDIITQDEADTIFRLKNIKPVNLKDIKKYNLGDNLEKLSLERKTDNPESVNLFYHLIASVAHLAAIEVNDKTDFSDAAADILNNGALVQVYTKAKQGKSEWTLENFDTVYPGQSIEGVYLSAGKNYFSTGIKGNYTFKIDKGTGKPKKDKNVDIGDEPLVSTGKEELAKAAKAIATGVGRPISMAPEPKKGVGRAKRK